MDKLSMYVKTRALRITDKLSMYVKTWALRITDKLSMYVKTVSAVALLVASKFVAVLNMSVY